MYPILIEWGPLLVPAWHAFFALGAIFGFLAFSNLSKRTFIPLSDRDAGAFFLVNYIAGYFGARFLSIIIEQRNQIHQATDIIEQLLTLGPMTFYGGVLGGITASMIWITSKNRDVKSILDAAMPALMLGLCLGRIGCFLNGDDFGKALSAEVALTSPWWGVIFPNLGDGVMRFPVQLFESLAALILFGFGSIAVIRQSLQPGFTGLATIAVYAFSRFFLEMLRGDPRGWVVENLLSPSQLVSVIVLLVAVVTAWQWQPPAPIRK